MLRQAREAVRAESSGGEVSYVRKSMLAQQKSESRQKQLLEMKFADEAGDEEQGSSKTRRLAAAGPAAGGVREDASQERPQEQS